jgi:hypothetical protein
MAFYLPLLRQTGKDYLIMLKSITLVFISIFAANSVSLSDVDAKELSWATLADVEYKDVYLEELDAWFWQPEFGDAVKEYSG